MNGSSVMLQECHNDHQQYRVGREKIIMLKVYHGRRNSMLCGCWELQ